MALVPDRIRTSDKIGHGLARTGDIDMQVQPIAALRPVKIRPRQTQDTPFVGEREARARAEFIPPQPEPQPALATVQALDGYSPLTAQLLISHQARAQTVLERSAQVSSYTAAMRSGPAAPKLSVSV